MIKREKLNFASGVAAIKLSWKMQTKLPEYWKIAFENNNSFIYFYHQDWQLEKTRSVAEPPNQQVFSHDTHRGGRNCSFKTSKQPLLWISNPFIKSRSLIAGYVRFLLIHYLLNYNNWKHIRTK